MRVVLGVTGGIAAYKAAEIVRALTKRGDDVRVIMTSGAQEFITPLTLQVLSGNRVGTELFDPTYESEIGHIELARWAEVILVAPASANTLAKLAAGMADDLLTTVITATTAPVILAPAMNTQMLLNPVVQRNIQTLRDYNFHIVSPDSGELACKEVGAGRLPDADVLMDAVDAVQMPQVLAGKHVLITAGPTREHMDPARFISNPSTGKMGFALARAAQQMGARVTLVSGPVELATPGGVERIDVTSAVQMFDRTMALADSADVVICCAAVADWRPAQQSELKRAKSEMSDALQLERNPDILLTLGTLYGPGQGAGPFVVGFAAETHDVEERGREKMLRKNAHMLIANQVGGASNAFGADASSAILITPTSTQPLSLASKNTLAAQILEKVAASLT